MGHAGHKAQGYGRRRHEVECFRSCTVAGDREVEQTTESGWDGEGLTVLRLALAESVREESTSPKDRGADGLRWRLDDCVGRRWGGIRMISLIHNKFKLSVSQR